MAKANYIAPGLKVITDIVCDSSVWLMYDNIPAQFKVEEIIFSLTKKGIAHNAVVYRVRVSDEEVLELNRSQIFKTSEELIKQLNKWIFFCEEQAEIFKTANMEFSELSSNAMKQAYTNVKLFIQSK